MLANSAENRSPVVDFNAKKEMMNTFVGKTKSVQEDQQPEQKDHMEKNDTEEEMLNYINSVSLTDKREDLRVTVEITHPALSLPVYLTWTGN